MAWRQIGLADEDRLIEKLHKIETLFARPATEGERMAAGNALDRIRARLKELERSGPPIEVRFSLPDTWSRSLLIALLRRYGLTPYRYPGQRRTTVMAKVTDRFVNETLWPEFQQLNATLRGYLDEVTQRVIAEAIDRDVSDAEERSGEAGKAGAGGSAQSVLDLE